MMGSRDETRRLRGRAAFAVALGSNLGDRLAFLAFGVERIRVFSEGLRVSSVYETEPRYVETQGDFLNAACTGLTRLTPRQLLGQLQDAERAAGRVREGTRFGPRVLDMDLLLFGDRVIEESDLVVPHPRLAERGFVLCPLAEIAGEWLVPDRAGGPPYSVESLAAAVGSEGVRRRDDLEIS